MIHGNSDCLGQCPLYVCLCLWYTCSDSPVVEPANGKAAAVSPAWAETPGPHTSSWAPAAGQEGAGLG